VDELVQLASLAAGKIIETGRRQGDEDIGSLVNPWDAWALSWQNHLH
jgi:hypothetical protein